jgi:hypothetical protein
MPRNMKIAAALSIMTLCGTPVGLAQGLTWGVFRENADSIPVNQRNCWSQAMVSGQTINGEVLAQGLTREQAAFTLRRDSRHGLCASQRTSTNWTARQDADDPSNGSSGDGMTNDWHGQH